MLLTALQRRNFRPERGNRSTFLNSFCFGQVDISVEMYFGMYGKIRYSLIRSGSRKRSFLTGLLRSNSCTVTSWYVLFLRIMFTEYAITFLVYSLFISLELAISLIHVFNIKIKCKWITCLNITLLFTVFER
jgi:hypothetical protein